MLELFSVVSGYLLGQGIQIAAIFGIVWAACFLLRRRSAHLRYLLWLLVIAKCIFPSVMKVSLAVFPEKVAAVVVAETIVQAPPAAAVSVAVEFDSAVYGEPVFAQASFIDLLKDISLLSWAGIIWGCGVVLFFGVVCFKAWRLNRKLRLMRKEADVDGDDTIKVWQIDGIGQPFVWGLLKGSVYLPGDFASYGSDDDRRGILMHEFAHVRRFDAGVNVLQIIAQGIFWFHPLVWVANTMIRREREKCCDEAAIAGLKTVPRDYGKAIIDTLTREYESNIPVGSLAIAGPVKNIEDRIKTIMRPGKKFYGRCGIFAMITVILLAAIALPTGCVLTRRGGTTTKQVRNYVRLVGDDDGIVFEGRHFEDISDLDNAITKLNNKSNTVLEWAFAPGEMPESGSMGWFGVWNAIDEMEQLVKKHGLAGLCFASELPVGSKGAAFAPGFESQFALNKDIPLQLHANGPIEIQSIKFETKPEGSKFKAMLKAKVTSWPKAKWEIRLEFRTDDPTEMGSLYKTFENSGTVAGVAAISNKIIEIPLPESMDADYMDEIKNFEVRIREVSTGNTKIQSTNPKTDPIMFHGLDLSKNEVTTPYSKVTDLCERWPVGSNSYIHRIGVDTVYSDTEWVVYYISAKNIFYVNHLAGPSSPRLYGPFEGKPPVINRSDADIERDRKRAADFRLGKNIFDSDITPVDENMVIMVTYDVFSIVKTNNMEHFDDPNFVENAKIETQKIADHIEKNIFPSAETDNDRRGRIKLFGPNKLLVWQVPAVHRKIRTYIDGLQQKADKAVGRTEAPIMFHGLDLSKAPVTTEVSELAEVFKERPDVYGRYLVRGEIYEMIYRGRDGMVLGIPSKNIFYVQHNQPVSGTKYYYGPFEGDPRKILKNVPTRMEWETFPDLDLPDHYLETAVKAGARTYVNESDLDDLFEEDPKVSWKYRTRKEVIVFHKYYYVPSKNVFYQRQPSSFGFAGHTYFGPFPGDPRTMPLAKKKPVKTQVLFESRFMEVSPGFLEKIGIGVKAKKGWWFFKPKKIEKAEGVTEIGDIKEPYYKPEVSYDLFEGDEAIEGKLAEDYIRRMKGDGPDGISVYYIDDATVKKLIRASQQEKDARILTSPSVLVHDGESAMMETRSELAYARNYEELLDDENKTVEVITKMLEIGIKLGLKPLVLKDKGTIDLNVDLDVSTLLKLKEYKNKSGQSYEIPQWEQIRLKTRLPVTEGKTLMITGIKTAGGTLRKLSGKDGKTVPGELENMIILIKAAIVKPFEDKTIQE